MTKIMQDSLPTKCVHTNHLRILAIGSSLLTLDIVNANFTLLSFNRRLINSLAMSYRLAPTNRLASSR